MEDYTAESLVRDIAYTLDNYGWRLRNNPTGAELNEILERLNNIRTNGAWERKLELVRALEDTED